MISKEIFLRLMEVYKTDKMNELSVLMGYKESWGASTRKRDGIPFEACVKAAQTFNISLDYLIFGKENTSEIINENELRISVTEGIFAAIQTDMISLGKDVKISRVAEIITSEIKEGCNISDDLQQKLK